VGRRKGKAKKPRRSCEQGSQPYKPEFGWQGGGKGKGQGKGQNAEAKL